MAQLFSNVEQYTAAVIASNSRDFSKSIPIWMTLLEQKPSSANYWACLGHDYLDSGDSAAAKNAFSIAIQNNKDNWPAWYGLVLIYLEAEDLENARQAIEKVLTFEATSANHVIYASILRKIGKLQEAKLHCKKAIELDDSYEEAFLNLALISQIESNWSEAIEYLNRAIELDPHFASAYEALANIYQDLGNDSLSEIYRQDAKYLRKVQSI